MAQELLYIYFSVAVVSLIALVGIVMTSLDQDRLHTIVLYLVSFSAGTLFGDIFLPIVPEFVRSYGFEVITGSYLLSGIVLAFVVEK